MVYEGLLIFGVLFFSEFIFDVTTQSRHALKLRYAREAFQFLVIGAYFIYFWRRGGQTLAMQTWRIRLVNNDQKELPLMKAVVRYCLAWMWFLPGIIVAHQLGLKNAQLLIPITLGFIGWAATCLLSADRQFLHDVFAKTRLVELPAPTKTSNQEAKSQ